MDKTLFVRFMKIRIFNILITIILALILIGCDSDDTWNCVVYPDREDLTESLKIGKFNTLEGCGIAAVKTLDRFQALDRGDYECGKNCRKDSTSPSFLVCEETTKADIPIESAHILYPRDDIAHALEKLFISEIYQSYNSEDLTYPGMLKAWFAKTAVSLKVPISSNLVLFADSQKKFANNVSFLGMVSDSVVPTMEMSPTEFEVYFDGLAKEKGLGLKLSD